MQSLINKINKSIVAPLPVMYSGAFRGLVKSMLRKNPELRPSGKETSAFWSSKNQKKAADLLRLPYVQPYVFNLHLNSSSPRRHTFPTQQLVTNHVKQTRFPEPEVTMFSDRQKSIGEESIIDKTVATKSLSSVKSPIFTPAKVSTTPRRKATPKIYTTMIDCDLKQKSQTPSSKPMQSTRRASLPSLAKNTSKTPYKASTGLLHDVASPNVSVDAPRIDKIAEFPSASSEEPFFPGRENSTSAQCSSTSPSCDNISITKDRCTIQILDRSRRTITRSYIPNVNFVAPTRSECSETNQQIVSQAGHLQNQIPSNRDSTLRLTSNERRPLKACSSSVQIYSAEAISRAVSAVKAIRA